MAAASNIVVIVTTINDPDHATRLARQLLEERLIACSTVIPGATSYYWWKDEITSDTEAVLLMKTTVERIEQLKARMLQLHPYSVPEFIVLRAFDVTTAYAAWVEASTQAQEH